MKKNIKKEGNIMKLEEGVLYKHFKGRNLIEKNIYEIIKIGVQGQDIINTNIIYTGEKENYTDSNNLVIYKNIFSDKVFAREYEDLICELSLEKQEEFLQKCRIYPLTEEETEIVKTKEFQKEKVAYKK